MLDADVFGALQMVSTCNVADALELHGVTPGKGVVRGLAKINKTNQIMVGLASTATFRAAERRPQRFANQTLSSQLDDLSNLPGPGVVVFQDLDTPWFGATGGEIRCRFYELAGAVGVVTSGALRDVEG